MGNYRTTLFRRDFNRLQAQRNHGLPKEPVALKQGATQDEKDTVPITADATALDLHLQQIATANASEDGDAALSINSVVNVGQMSTFSEEERQLDKVHCILPFN